MKTLAYYKADKVELNYTLERRAPGAPWKIANYVIDGVDTVRNYKSSSPDFSLRRVLRR